MKGFDAKRDKRQIYTCAFFCRKILFTLACTSWQNFTSQNEIEHSQNHFQSLGFNTKCHKRHSLRAACPENLTKWIYLVLHWSPSYFLALNLSKLINPSRISQNPSLGINQHTDIIPKLSGLVRKFIGVRQEIGIWKVDESPQVLCLDRIAFRMVVVSLLHQTSMLLSSSMRHQAAFTHARQIESWTANSLISQSAHFQECIQAKACGCMHLQRASGRWKRTFLLAFCRHERRTHCNTCK